MKIAILGWGSLIWSSRSLQVREDRWHREGPFLPVEFARVSQDGRLTLVLYRDALEVQTLWGYFAFTDLKQAIENLRVREGAGSEGIGFVSLADGSHRCRVVPRVLNRIRDWAKEKGFDAVVWTDLPSNFEERTGMGFTEVHVIRYLKGLSGEDRNRAETYSRKAPKQIATRIRSRIETELGWIWIE